MINFLFEFYKNLFKEKKPLEYAFLKTRQSIYEKYKDNKVWAASMLITQITD